MQTTYLVEQQVVSEAKVISLEVNNKIGSIFENDQNYDNHFDTKIFCCVNHDVWLIVP